MKKLILASGSPRRKELLARLGLEFEVVVSTFDEHLVEGRSPIEQAQHLALAKATALVDDYPEDVIIAADTIVVLDGVILGKPINKEDARKMLRLLSGKKHQVITGFAVIQGARKVVGAEQTDVFFRHLTEEEIENYLVSGEYVDKAGGYGIQGIGSLLVEKINGCYFNVVGLPLSRIHQVLKQFGYNVI
ncbi:MAG TPA: septum formation inhibitor Maf [Clostridia bacterium]|nr:septum formation inhibitor Maf [Clostridia bacterium]